MEKIRLTEVKIKSSYETIQDALAALRKELERLEMLVFDPSKVLGSILIRFDTEGWPDGWVWPEQQEGWSDPADDDESDAEPLEPDTYYNIVSQYLESDDGKKERKLSDFVREWLLNTLG